jgi:hypothetical protein
MDFHARVRGPGPATAATRGLSWSRLSACYIKIVVTIARSSFVGSRFAHDYVVGIARSSIEDICIVDVGDRTLVILVQCRS